MGIHIVYSTIMRTWARFHPLLATFVAVFLLSTAAKLLVLVFLMGQAGGVENLILGDSGHYLELARSTLAGTGYWYEGHIESFRAPGYPLYLGFFLATGIPLVVASLFQILVASLLPVLVVACGVRYLKLPLAWATAAGVLTALEPVLTFYAVALMPDVFFAVGTFAALLLLVRWHERGRLRDIILAGVLIGLANYMRPAMLYFPLFFAVLALGVYVVKRRLTKKRLVHIMLFILVPVAVMSPWYLRNYVEFGVPGFVSAKGFTVYRYSAASVESIATGVPFDEVTQSLLARARAEAPLPNLESFEDEPYLLAASKALIAAHPVAYVQSYLLGLNTFWFSGNYHYLLAKYGLISRPTTRTSFSLVLATQGIGGVLDVVWARIESPYLLIAIFGKVLWLVVGLFALVGLLLYRRTPFALITLVLALYSCATILATTIGVEARHRYYLNPLLFLFFVATLYLLYVWNHHRHSRPQ